MQFPKLLADKGKLLCYSLMFVLIVAVLVLAFKKSDFGAVFTVTNAAYIVNYTGSPLSVSGWDKNGVQVEPTVTIEDTKILLINKVTTYAYRFDKPVFVNGDIIMIPAKQGGNNEYYGILSSNYKGNARITLLSYLVDNTGPDLISGSSVIFIDQENNTEVKPVDGTTTKYLADQNTKWSIKLKDKTTGAISMPPPLYANSKLITTVDSLGFPSFISKNYKNLDVSLTVADQIVNTTGGNLNFTLGDGTQVTLKDNEKYTILGEPFNIKFQNSKFDSERGVWVQTQKDSSPSLLNAISM